MKKILFSLILLFLFSNINFAQINFHAKIGTGISQFYKLQLSNLNDGTQMRPAIGSKIGIGMKYNYNNYRNGIIIDILLEQKILKSKTFVNDSILWITDDTSYYIYDDIINRINYYTLSLPIIFTKDFNRNIGIGIGLTNSFIFNNQEILKIQNIKTLKYQLNFYMSINYQLIDKIGIYVDFQNNITPFGANNSTWSPYLLYNCIFSLGLNYNFK